MTYHSPINFHLTKAKNCSSLMAMHGVNFYFAHESSDIDILCDITTENPFGNLVWCLEVYQIS